MLEPLRLGPRHCSRSTRRLQVSVGWTGPARSARVLSNADRRFVTAPFLRRRPRVLQRAARRLPRGWAGGRARCRLCLDPHRRPAARSRVLPLFASSRRRVFSCWRSCLARSRARFCWVTFVRFAIGRFPFSSARTGRSRACVVSAAAERDHSIRAAYSARLRSDRCCQHTMQAQPSSYAVGRCWSRDHSVEPSCACDDRRRHPPRRLRNGRRQRVASRHGDCRTSAGEPRLLRRHPRDAAGQEERQSGRSRHLPPVLRRCRRASGNGPHLLSRGRTWRRHARAMA